MMRQGEEEEEEEEMMMVATKPAWLEGLMAETFFSSCGVHESRRKSEKNVFCLLCCLSVCPHCLPSHRSHPLLQVLIYTNSQISPRIAIILSNPVKLILFCFIFGCFVVKLFDSRWFFSDNFRWPMFLFLFYMSLRFLDSVLAHIQPAIHCVYVGSVTRFLEENSLFLSLSLSWEILDCSENCIYTLIYIYTYIITHVSKFSIVSLNP